MGGNLLKTLSRKSDFSSCSACVPGGEKVAVISRARNRPKEGRLSC